MTEKRKEIHRKTGVLLAYFKFSINGSEWQEDAMSVPRFMRIWTFSSAMRCFQLAVVRHSRSNDALQKKNTPHRKFLSLSNLR